MPSSDDFKRSLRVTVLGALASLLLAGAFGHATLPQPASAAFDSLPTHASSAVAAQAVPNVSCADRELSSSDRCLRLPATFANSQQAPGEGSPDTATTASGPFARLPEVTFHSHNAAQSVSARLYAQGTNIDEAVAEQLDSLFADVRDPKQPKQNRIDRRLLQLLYRAAYHFRSYRIEVVSAYREPRRKREGLHALGRAIDFRLPGVKLEILASYLRNQARVGVGIYTHRRTRFVHLDIRESSYHWLDASPPGRTWRGLSIGNTAACRKRDLAYQASDDWPELEPTQPPATAAASTRPLQPPAQPVLRHFEWPPAFAGRPSPRDQCALETLPRVDE
jgi:uncharacterized protein YcbK (DUF882 family)